MGSLSAKKAQRQVALEATNAYTSARENAGIRSGASVTTSDTAPENPTDGDMWFNTELLELYLYYDDGATSQWVSASQPGPQGPAGSGGESGGGATTYANYAAFPSSGNTTGDFAIALDTKALYMWDGDEWDRVYIGANETPEWVTEPESQYFIISSPINISVEATDPEGFPIAYSYDTNPSDQNLATITNNNDGTFTATPTGSFGDFVLRIKATDGVISSSRTTTIVISTPPTSVEYLLAGGGGGGGGWAGGGGGGGGVLTGTLSISNSTTYNIAVGEGGAGAIAGTYPGTWYHGYNTTFDTLTAYGGGGGGGFGGAPSNGGVNGGSGGGASYSITAGTGVAGQGYAGSSQSGSYYGGGGGGAGTAGTGSNGGIGIEWPAGSGNYYGGGGGAGGGYIAVGTGGLGGGGSGGTGAKSSLQDGLANTGGGGGGAHTPNTTGTSQQGGGNGGSGVVIIRYPSIYLDATSTTGTVEYTNANGYKTYKFTAGSASITW